MIWAVKHFRHYLYSHHRTVSTNHKTLKSLLNTAHLSGKLAQCEMTLQELDLKIEYQPRKTNVRADALSWYAASLLASNCSNTQTAAVVANLDSASPNAVSGKERTLEERQKDDPSLTVIKA